jgi:hypothetical protein
MRVSLIDRNGKRGPQAGTHSPKQAMTSATAAWKVVPDWLFVLAEACDRSSQSKVAKRLGYSGSVVSSVLNAKYNGDYSAVEKAIRGALMSETLDCPVLGDINTKLCLEHQKRARSFQPTSSMRVRLYKHCRGECLHSRLNINAGGENAQS